MSERSPDTAPFDDPDLPKAVRRRATEIFEENYFAVTKRTDRLFMWLMLGQWLAAIVFAWLFSPLAWAGRESAVHGHVYAAVLLGGLIVSLPVMLVLRRTGEQTTRYVVASAQVCFSALLIHLTGGRIETHFHIFGSLAILAFYRDLKVLVPATVIVAADHFIRGIYWPESVYGVLNPEWWRFLEHAGWVVFIDVFLILNCLQSYRELQNLSLRQAQVEASQEDALRFERLAAVGQLAASVGHELRNPLAAIRNAHTYLDKRIAKAGGEQLPLDDRTRKFIGLIERELEASSKIISNLLDFSRPRPPQLAPCPLGPLAKEALEMVPERPGVELVLEMPEDLAVPDLDKDLMRQVLVNLVQNASEAMPETGGTVTVKASHAPGRGWTVTVADDGPGISAEHLEEIFKPLFSTKTKGTGLGLAVVSAIVERHAGHLDVESEIGRGTTFTITLPPTRQAAAAE